MSENLNNKVNKERKHKSKVKSLDFLKFYEKDRNLFRIIDQTKNVKKTSPYKEEEKELKETLYRIKTELQFTNEPKIHILKTENDDFSKNYQKLSKKKNSLGPEDTFREIIEEYKERGYKIPTLTVENNIFRMNPLIEGNEDRIYDGFYSSFISHTESHRGKNIAIQTIVYLKKLKNIVEKKIFEIHKNNKDRNIISTREEVLMPNINLNNKNNDNEETDEQILEKIKILLELIKVEPLTDYKTYNPFYSPNKFKPKVINNKFANIIRSKSRTQTKKHSKKIMNKFFSKKHVSESFKKFSSGIFQNKFSNTISKKKEKPFYLLSESKAKKNVSNFSIDSPKLISSNLKSRNNNKKHDFLNTHVKTLENQFDSELNTNRAFNSTNYTNRTNHTTQNFFYRPKEKNLLKIAYESLVKDNFYKVEQTSRNYLKKVKGFSDDKIVNFIAIRSKNNFLNNINEIQTIISQKKIRKKSEKIYLNDNIIQRIKPKLQKMCFQESLIKKLDKNYIKLLVDE